jgi:hypothetical protein
VRILINRQPLDWPKQVISVEQLRQYADALEATHDMWLSTSYGPDSKITAGTAPIYEGAVFYSAPKHINGG